MIASLKALVWTENFEYFEILNRSNPMLLFTIVDQKRRVRCIDYYQSLLWISPHPTLDAVHASIAQLHWYKWQGIELDKNIVKLLKWNVIIDAQQYLGWGK